MLEVKKISNKNFISSLDVSESEIKYLIDLAISLKENRIKLNVGEKVLGLIFDKSSTRTRVSFQVAMFRLGGQTIEINPETAQLGRGESIKDTARVLSKYCDAIAVRTSKQEYIEEYAKWSTIPVINALTDQEHPCQALADYLTIKEEFNEFKNKIICYVGDGNNVANSLLICGSLLGCEVRIACPKGFEPDFSLITQIKKNNLDKGEIIITDDPFQAAKGAHVLYTDVWSSMGQEDEKESKEKIFKNFCLNQDLLNIANKRAIVMHCLPAYKGKEITEEVMEGDRNRIFEQAENRLYAQQALLASMI